MTLGTVFLIILVFKMFVLRAKISIFLFELAKIHVNLRKLSSKI